MTFFSSLLLIMKKTVSTKSGAYTTAVHKLKSFQNEKLLNYQKHPFYHFLSNVRRNLSHCQYGAGRIFRYILYRYTRCASNGYRIIARATCQANTNSNKILILFRDNNYVCHFHFQYPYFKIYACSQQQSANLVLFYIFISNSKVQV